MVTGTGGNQAPVVEARIRRGEEQALSLFTEERMRNDIMGVVREAIAAP
jgi:hypothetical protein